MKRRIKDLQVENQSLVDSPDGVFALGQHFQNVRGVCDGQDVGILINRELRVSGGRQRPTVYPWCGRGLGVWRGLSWAGMPRVVTREFRLVKADAFSRWTLFHKSFFF